MDGCLAVLAAVMEARQGFSTLPSRTVFYAMPARCLLPFFNMTTTRERFTLFTTNGAGAVSCVADIH